MDYGMQNNQTVRVDKFILAQTGTYMEQTIRPLKTNVDERVTNMLIDATMQGKRLGSAAVDTIAAQVIRPASQIEGLVQIPEGWRSRRFRFLMRVEEYHPFIPNEKTIRLFFGYSDHCDASIQSGLLPGDMRIYFNTETVIIDKITSTPNGPVRHAMVTSANQIITPLRIQSAGQVGGDLRSYLVRPEDVFNMRELELSANMYQAQTGIGIDYTYDYRSVSGTDQFQLSKRRDTSPTRYLADTLGALQHAVAEDKMNQNRDFSFNQFGQASANRPLGPQVYSEAAARCGNDNINGDLFLSRLRDHAGYMEKGYVTLADLNRLFPETMDRERVTHAGMDDGRSIRRINHFQDSETWTGADPTTIAASMLSQVVPAIMMDNFLRHIGFAITNSLQPGQYNFMIMPDLTRSLVSELEMTPYLQEFQRRLCLEAINSITFNGQIPFNITMSSDLAGDSVIDISLNNEPTTRYVAPTFTDSLSCPLVTTNYQLASKISNDMIHIASEVLGIGDGKEPDYTPTIPLATGLKPSTFNAGYDGDAENFGLL